MMVGSCLRHGASFRGIVISSGISGGSRTERSSSSDVQRRTGSDRRYFLEECAYARGRRVRRHRVIPDCKSARGREHFKLTVVNERTITKSRKHSSQEEQKASVGVMSLKPAGEFYANWDNH